MEKEMLDILFKLFSGNALVKANGVCKHVLDLVGFYEKEFAQDHDTFNAAIDAACEMLKSQKRVAEAPKADVLPDVEAQ